MQWSFSFFPSGLIRLDQFLNTSFAVARKQNCCWVYFLCADFWDARSAVCQVGEIISSVYISCSDNAELLSMFKLVETLTLTLYEQILIPTTKGQLINFSHLFDTHVRHISHGLVNLTPSYFVAFFSTLTLGTAQITRWIKMRYTSAVAGIM